MSAPAANRELTVTESGRLAELEAVVERGLETFVEVGTALAEIRDRWLYRATHRTFADYCGERWGMGRSHAYRMIDAAGVAEIVSPNGDTPATEAVARELVPLKGDPEQARAAWSAAVTRNGPTPTARQVRETVKQRLSLVDDDLAKRASAGTASLEYAESVTAERRDRLDAWASEIRRGLRVLRRMAGHPVPDGVAARLTVDERAQLDLVLDVLAEAFGAGA